MVVLLAISGIPEGDCVACPARGDLLPVGTIGNSPDRPGTLEGGDLFSRCRIPGSDRPVEALRCQLAAIGMESDSQNRVFVAPEHGNLLTSLGIPDPGTVVITARNHLLSVGAESHAGD